MGWARKSRTDSIKTEGWCLSSPISLLFPFISYSRPSSLPSFAFSSVSPPSFSSITNHMIIMHRLVTLCRPLSKRAICQSLVVAVGALMIVPILRTTALKLRETNGLSQISPLVNSRCQCCCLTALLCFFPFLSLAQLLLLSVFHLPFPGVVPSVSLRGNTAAPSELTNNTATLVNKPCFGKRPLPCVFV